MDTLYIPNENDIKRWIREAVKECFLEANQLPDIHQGSDETLLNRKEIAGLLRISLVTLTDWIKRGLPSHKQGNRVYFVKSEVLEYIRKKKTKTAVLWMGE
jgi:excisionase family DNA binding protein